MPLSYLEVYGVERWRQEISGTSLASHGHLGELTPQGPPAAGGRALVKLVTSQVTCLLNFLARQCQPILLCPMVWDATQSRSCARSYCSAWLNIP